MAWTDEGVETLKAMWAEGHSAREIGERLGFTRNAVIGKANRLGLSHARAAKEAPAAAAAEAPRAAPMNSLELNERMCRWPIGHPGEPEFHFCGNPRLTGRPYCAEHCSLAYRGKAVEAA